MNQFLTDDATRLRFIEAVRKRDYLYDRTSSLYKDLELKQRAWEAIVVECNVPSVKDARNAWKKMRDNFRDSLRRTLALQNGSSQNLTPYRYHQQMTFLEPFVSSKNFENKPDGVQETTEPLVLLSHLENGDEEFETTINVADPLEIDADTPVVLLETLPARVAEFNNNKRERSLLESNSVKKKRTSSEMETVGSRANRMASHRDENKLNASAYSSSNHLDVFFKSMCETTKAMPEKWQLEVKKRIFEVVSHAEEDMLNEHETAKRRFSK